MKVPYVDLGRHNAAIEQEILEAVGRVVRRGDFVLGREVSRLEKSLADALAAGDVVGVSNGTDALVLALRASGIGPGDEVITVSHLFLATASAICLAGATPVFVDIDRETMLMDPALVEEALTPKTRAVVPVHLNGHACRLDEIAAVCEAHGLTLIEDCAQAIGTLYRGRAVGTFGIGCFSLHPLKVLSACGDAGFVATADDALAERLRELRNLGLHDRDHCHHVSGNHRLDTLQAAILEVKLGHLPAWQATRAGHAGAYREGLTDLVELPPQSPECRDNYGVFVVRHPRRDRLYETLRARGIDVKIHYPVAIDQQPPFSGFARAPLPVTESTVQTIMSLPISAELSVAHRSLVIEELRAAVGGALKDMRDPGSKILALEELQKVREEARTRGEVVVQCHGCFDIVHPGHLRYLRFAKDQGSCLIVSVSADQVVGKGPGRPYVGEDLRAENLAALEFVDYVTIDHHTWAGPVLEALEPDVYVKGREYATNADPRFVKEKNLVERYGGRVIFSSGDVVYSSSYILERFRERFDLDQQRIKAFCGSHSVTPEALARAVRSFVGRRVLVIGDPILDRYSYCEAGTLATDAPVLSVTPVREELYAGGAFLVASQMAHLGATVTVLGPRGGSAAHAELAELLGETGITWVGPGIDSRPVFSKTRYIVDQQKVLKVNHGVPAPLSEAANRSLGDMLADLWEGHDALVVCDFGFGLLSHVVASRVNELAARGHQPVYLDVSGRGQMSLLKLKGMRLTSPTELELRGALGDHESGLSHLAHRLLQQTGAAHLALTLHERGVMLFLPAPEGSDRMPTDYLPSMHPGATADAVGAGDVFLAGLALCDLATADPGLGLYVGSCLADLHVSRMGNGPEALVDLEGMWAVRPELRSP